MRRRINNGLLKMQLKAISAMHELKNDDRGLSGVVVAILLILIAVLAVVLIWGFLSGWLAELWEQITTTSAIE